MARHEKKKEADAVEGLKASLYSREHEPDFQPTSRTPLEPQDIRVPLAWEKEEEEAAAAAVLPQRPLTIMDLESQPTRSGFSAAMKFFIGSVCLFRPVHELRFVHGLSFYQYGSKKALALFPT